VLDAGDFNDFMRIELQGTDGAAGLELLELAGYDGIAIGNNETFNGAEILERMAIRSKVPFLSCNLMKKDDGPFPGVRSSVIVSRGKLRFLVIGTSPQMDAFYPLLGFQAIDYKAAIRQEMSRNSGGYDICILLSHLGLKEDRDIAETMEGIDLIIDGHTHLLMEEPLLINGTILHMSGCYGDHLGVLDCSFDDGIVEFKGENRKLEHYAPNEKILESLRNSKEKAIRNLSEPLFSIEEDLWHDVVEENPITNLLADALRAEMGGEIGLINSGIINSGVRKGKVSKKKLIEMCPSPLNPTSFYIQGKYIRQAFEASIHTDVCMLDGKGAGFRGKYLGRLHISGGSVEYCNHKIVRIQIGEDELDDERHYLVATSDYLHRGTGYESLKNNHDHTYHPDMVRDTIEKYLKKPNFRKRAREFRWKESSI